MGGRWPGSAWWRQTKCYTQSDEAEDGHDHHGDNVGTVAAVKITPVWIAHHLQVGRHREGCAHEHRPLHVLGDQGQVRRTVVERRRGEQSLLSGPFPAAETTAPLNTT